LFEKKLVEKFVKETGKCPVTNELMSLDDLMPLKANKTVKPRPSPATSIPGLLGLFHDEWDALMLETHSLRQSLHNVRQELSHALYLHDASTRVIARLIRERDEARSSLQNVKATLAAESDQAAKRGSEAVAIEETDGDAKKQKKASLPESVIEELQAVNSALSKGRKKRAISESLATTEDLQNSSVIGSHPLHQTTQGGIVALDINPESPHVLATAGLDSTVQIFDHVQARILGSLQGHSKRLTSVAYVTSTVRLGKCDEYADCSFMHMQSF
jgi:pre-mRNA-processing factor 19